MSWQIVEKGKAWLLCCRDVAGWVLVAEGWLATSSGKSAEIIRFFELYNQDSRRVKILNAQIDSTI
jgi:thymidine kinase